MRCPLDIEFVRILREYQRREEISDAELARRMGMYPSQLCQIFSDEYEGSVKLKTMYQALNRIGVEVDFLAKFPSREKIPA